MNGAEVTQAPHVDSLGHNNEATPLLQSKPLDEVRLLLAKMM